VTRRAGLRTTGPPDRTLICYSGTPLHATLVRGIVAKRSRDETLNLEEAAVQMMAAVAGGRSYFRPRKLCV
jgi:hypothetical protein